MLRTKPHSLLLSCARDTPVKATTQALRHFAAPSLESDRPDIEPSTSSTTTHHAAPWAKAFYAYPSSPSNQ